MDTLYVISDNGNRIFTGMTKEVVEQLLMELGCTNHQFVDQDQFDKSTEKKNKQDEKEFEKLGRKDDKGSTH